jgi:23S rRNA maturation-related 3'-5' exoribonuclease YhaM
MNNMENKFIKLAREHFLSVFEKADPNVILYSYLPKHVAECEKWAKRVLESHPEANQEIVLLAVWLHDIGQAFSPKEEDHAVKSEREARRFLSEIKYPSDLLNRVVHCIRSHRNKDVPPESIEARIMAAADSASHMTDICYIDMAQNAGKEVVLSKIERDYRDVGFFTDLKKEITPLYKAWKQLIDVFPN